MNKELLTDEEIRLELERIQPYGFDWADIAECEMVKFKAVAQDQLAKAGPLIRADERAKTLREVEAYLKAACVEHHLAIQLIRRYQCFHCMNNLSLACQSGTMPAKD